MAVEPLFVCGSPVTYSVKGNVRQGRLVELLTGADNGKVQEAGATSLVVAGVARDNAVESYDPNTPVTYATGVTYPAVDSSVPRNIVGVAAEGVWYLLAGSTGITAGMRLKAGAAGTVVPWVSGTDSAAAVVGFALEAITNGTTGKVRLSL